MNTATADKTASMKNNRGRPKLRQASYSLYVRVPPELGEALEQYQRSLRIRPALTSIAEVALQDFLKAEGFWPPRPDSDGQK
jgi:hypothetical protein